MKISDLLPTFLTAAAGQPTELHFTAPVQFTAAEGEGKLPRFSITAYKGGAMRVPQFHLPVVVELKGTRAAKRGVKVLRDHSTTQIVGHTDSVEINDQGIQAEGPVSGSGASANEIVASAKNGFPWEASIGARKLRMEPVERGRKVQVNGRSFEGPMFVARQAEIHEISFVALGADDETSASVAASAANNSSPGENIMKFSEWLKAKGIDNHDALPESVQTQLKAAYDAEQGDADKGKAGQTGSAANASGMTVTATAGNGNGQDVQQLVASAVQSALSEAQKTWQANQDHRTALMRITAAHPEIQAKAIAEAWSTEKAELEVIKASRPNVGSLYVNTGAGSEVAAEMVMTAAICQSGNLAGLDKQFDDKTLQAAHTRYRGRVGLQQLMLEAAWAGGFTGSHFDKSAGGMKEILQAAFSSMSLPGVLSNTANKFLLQSFMAVEQVWREVSAVRSVGDFKQVTSYRLTGGMEFEEVGKDGEIKHGEVGEESYTNRARTHGKMFAITRQDIINDDLGALTVVPQRIGRGGGLKLNKVFWTELEADHGTFFPTDESKGNYIDGASSALSAAGLDLADVAFRSQTDADKTPLGLTPRKLVVPIALRTTGRELMNSSLIVSGASSKTPNVNIWQNQYDVVASQYLTAAKVWYLTADPADLPMIETVFLNGVQQPTVESADADFNTLGVQMRGFFDFGVNKQDERAAVKSKGES